MSEERISNLHRGSLKSRLMAQMLFCVLSYIITNAKISLGSMFGFKIHTELRKATVSSVMSVRSSVCPRGNSAPNGRICMKFNI